MNILSFVLERNIQLSASVSKRTEYKQETPLLSERPWFPPVCSGEKPLPGDPGSLLTVISFNTPSPRVREQRNDGACPYAPCGMPQQHRTWFQLKAEAPTTKFLAGGVATRRISFFSGLCDLPFLRYTFKARLTGTSSALCISERRRECCAPPSLPFSSLYLSSSEKKERRKRSKDFDTAGIKSVEVLSLQ